VNEKLKENNDKMNTTTVEVMENMTKTGTYDEVVLITTTTLSLKEAQKILRVINPKDGEKEIKCMESETSKKTLKQYEDTFNLLTKNDANTTKMKTNTMTKGMKTAG
jgi:23S rRNA U2552 (ribose-2'-O)-methylase RlmE/FtsJ